MTARYIDSLRNQRISGFQWQDPEDESDRKMFRDILEYGFQVIGVDAGQDSPDFAYSVGLYLNFLHPEILIMGMSSVACFEAISQIAREAAAGKVASVGDTRSDLFEVQRSVRFVPVDKARYYDYLGYAAWFYRSLFYLPPKLECKFPVLQVLWPDRNLVYPDDPRCDENVCRVQTLVPMPRQYRD